MTCVAGKVDEPLEERDESARATGGETIQYAAGGSHLGGLSLVVAGVHRVADRLGGHARRHEVVVRHCW